MTAFENSVIDKSDITLFPNPTMDEVTLLYSNLDSNHEVTIFDMTSRLMQHISPIINENSTTSNVAKYPSGIYIVVLRQEVIFISQHKLIKQ